MAIPYRGTTRAEETYFVTFNCDGKRRLLQSRRMASLVIEVLLHHRSEGKYLLHEFVVMPNHFHGLFTTTKDTSLESAVGIIKGAVAFRAKRDFGLLVPIWQSSFVDTRMRDSSHYQNVRKYIFNNPIKAGFCQRPEEWPYSSIGVTLDEVPQRLKPLAKRRAAGLQP
jgi:putative transposase